jgi:DNA repair exonuclease SbcCD ATPase subunit
MTQTDSLTREQVAEQLHVLYLAKAHELGWPVRHECNVPYDQLTPDGQALDIMFADWHLEQLAALRAQLAQVTQQLADVSNRLEGANNRFERDQQRLAERDATIASLKEELEIGLQLTGSFFEALKPLKLSAIHVQNPGQHITDLIARVTELEAALKVQP